MLTLVEILQSAVEKNAADIFIIAGAPPICKLAGGMVALSEERLFPDSSEAIVRDIYQHAGRDMDRLMSAGDDDFSFTVQSLSRFRVSTYKQRGSLAAVIRIIPFGIPDYQTMMIPDEVMSVAKTSNGLILITGAAGSGKSTTLACIIDRINATKAGHIITLEDPIEYLHRNKKSLVSQREVSLDSQSYVTALYACLRQSPDVILLGEMRDLATIQTALTAAETGHLVISTLHTLGAANSIDRVIDVFPPAQQQQIRIQLSMLLVSVISQQLVPTVDGGLAPAFEIMHVNNAIKNMIREAKVHQLDSVISSSAGEGMISMDNSLLNLYKSGKITKENAVSRALNPDIMQKRIGAMAS